MEYLDDRTYKLTAQADDKTYGFEQQNAIKVGGVHDQSGPMNERRFLNALLGPNGEAVGYYREGSCCTFKTPNGLMGDAGLLDLYKVYWEGGTDTLSLYLNMYDEGELLIPVGFTAKE
ncbi:2-dehydro-3-deoxyphosphooctonate aldolase [Pontibacter mangrovi]|uniref:2-dehydro-3-deoxyphosphooctonate aldolase n=1 Tax=Pontibacter mangrovi TaxID=2589816 RepID=A0A501W6T4_9BACT|nr:2-dehydro-3-deoxyphosphooctonate aldolase [Pontibacter mangrovi]